MKISILSLFILFFFSTTRYVEASQHLFILSGQSNMVGLDPAISFTPTLEKSLGKGKVVIVKKAWNGKPISDWVKGWKDEKGKGPRKKAGLRYGNLMKAVQETSKGKTFKTVTFVWMQGEADAMNQHGKVYEKSLEALVDQISTDLGRKDLNVVIGRLSDFHLKSKKHGDWPLIRQIQVDLAQKHERWAWVDTDDLNDGKNKKGKALKNDLHYTPEGYKTLGRRFAEAAIHLTKKR